MPFTKNPNPKPRSLGCRLREEDFQRLMATLGLTEKVQDFLEPLVLQEIERRESKGGLKA